MVKMAQCKAKSKRSGEQCRRKAMIGKTVCYMHGGNSLGGIASPTFKTGRYSRYIPAQLADRYQEAQNDSDLLSLNDDVALIRSFTLKHLADMSTGDTHPAWIEAKKAYDKMEAAFAVGPSAIDRLITARFKLGEIIEPNYRAALSERQVIGNLDQLGRIANIERRLLIGRQQVITVEKMMLMIAAIAGSVKRHVSDRIILNAIQNDIQGLLVEGS